MPKCKLCGNNFLNLITIDNKERNLCNRKYCLECSPFGLHNTKQIHIEENRINSERICSICNRKFIYSKTSGHRGTKCNSCIQYAKYRKHKEKAIEYKGSKCQLCGYNKCFNSLTFHHLDESQKEFGIANNYNLSWERIRVELDKCILVCANCHGEIHADIITGLSSNG